MIYAASLAMPLKKAYGDQAVSSSQSRIMSLLNQDPAVSQMDVAVLGPKDLVGPRGINLRSAVVKAHPNVCIIYIYSKNNESEALDTPYKSMCKKITPPNLKSVIDPFIKDHTIQTGGARVSSKDFQTPDSDEVEQMFADETQIVPDFIHSATTETPDFIDPTTKKEDVAEAVEMPESSIPLPDAVTPQPTLDEVPLGEGPAIAEQVSVSHIPPQSLSTEEAISNTRSSAEWDNFMNMLKRESIVKKLIEENSEFRGLIQMIDTLDYEIQGVWLDTTLTSEQKFDKIKDIGLKRSSCLASSNSLMVDKVINIITKIALSAERTVEDEMEEYNAAISKIVANKTALADSSHITKAIEQRTDIQYNLLALSRRLLDLYRSMDNLITDELQSLDNKLPSSNDFINNFVKPVGTQIFTPANTHDLANALMSALQKNRLTTSTLESKVNSLIDYMFELFEKDREIIDYQQSLIAMLRANKIEDIVITSTVLKKCLRLWTGADGTGRSATAITWCGILSRRQNTLLIDLSGKAKFKEYGITPMSLEDFMNDRKEKRFMCVEASSIPTPEQLQDIVAELKTRLNYYAQINIIMDPDDIIGINQLCVDALTIHYICNCTGPSLTKLKNTIAENTYGNIARKLILIDPPVSPISIIDSLEVDPSLFATVTIPNVPSIRACALRHDRPYESEIVTKIYEEAFR